MARTGAAIMTAVALAAIGGGAWILADSGALAAESGSPPVIIDRPLDKASYDLIDIPQLPELKGFEMAAEGRNNDAPIRYKKDGDSVRYEMWLEDKHYITVDAALSKVSEKKSQLDVDVRLEDSPFTEDYGLLASDIPLLETMIDAALTEYIAAKLEGRGTGRYDFDDMEARIDFATMFQREAFGRRVQNAMQGAFATVAEKYAEDAKRKYRDSSSYSDSDYRGYQEQSRMRESQREASRPSSNAEPTTYLPTNR